MELIDTHVHLMMPDYTEIPGVIARAKAAGVTRFVVPGIDLKTSLQAIDLAKQYPEIVPAIGLHPMSPEEDLEKFRELAHLPEVKAIGEVGTDIRAGDWDKQKQRLEFFIQLASETNKPLLIHVIRTWDETLDLLSQYPQLRGKAVFHCFAAGPEEAKKIADLGLLISITAIIARNQMEPTHEVIKSWLLEHMMLETDGPWLGWPKEPWPNEPKTVAQVAAKIAEIKGVSLEEVATKTTQTATQFFSL